MSKHKGKKNQTATPKEPITRRDLCARIYALEKENDGLRSDNIILSLASSAQSDITKRSAELTKKADEARVAAIRIKDEYRKMNRVLTAALILSVVLHLINIFF